MFETRSPYKVTDFALEGGLLQKEYQSVWQGFAKNFKP
jgi:homogentisate 1,2-dioxygenase